MHSRLSFFLGALLITASPSVALSKSDQAALHFTIQVASFPDTEQANRFAVGLLGAGESPAFDTVAIEGRGYWTRVVVGLFDTPDAARRYAATLVARGLIKEFLVRRAGPNQPVSRPRRVADSDKPIPSTNGSLAFGDKALSADRAAVGSPAKPLSVMRAEAVPINNGSSVSQNVIREPLRTPLPVIEASLRLAPRVDTNLIPRPDPVRLAFKLVTSEGRNVPGAPAQQRGGLWVGGDIAEALTRLRWIIGTENAELIKLDPDGRVSFDMGLLAQAAGSGDTRVQDPLQAIDYISSNEGLLLLVQVSQGRHRYLLHIGRLSPTSGKSAETPGSINLDNNVDSRINRYRKNGRKLDGERPPEGFDSLIGLNPVARWFNLSTNCWVQTGEIVFHEIAEAHGKLEFGLDYLDQGLRPGAHSLALEREQRLKAQRPGADIVITTGSNRLLRTQEEIRLFTAEAAAAVSQR